MNKTVKVVVIGALLLVVSTAIAVAQNQINCEGPGKCKGTNESDVIVADNEDQKVIAKRGDDDIELDVVFPVGDGDDVAVGGQGRDCIDGGAGNDVFYGGPGDDNRPCEFTAFVNPRAGMTSGPGDDRVYGGPGDDSMDGIFDDDTLKGGPGNDLIEDPQTSDSDKLFGGSGDDELNATDGTGDDVVDGGSGEDQCSGDEGDEFRNCEEITDTPVSP